MCSASESVGAPQVLAAKVAPLERSLPTPVERFLVVVVEKKFGERFALVCFTAPNFKICLHASDVRVIKKFKLIIFLT